MLSIVVASSLVSTPALPSAQIPIVIEQIVIDDHVPVAAGARAHSRTIYLNRNGVTLTPGSNDSRTNRSSLISKAASIPPWNASDALWTETVSCLRAVFAPFDVHITEDDPGDVPHVEAVFGGTASLLGLPSNVSGIAPFSTSCNVVENALVFAFTDVLRQVPKDICDVMAQEIAHTYGLDHELLAEDPMSYLSYAGTRAFQDTMASCGETSPRACGAPGYASCRAKQNSYRLLLERLGSATELGDRYDGGEYVDADRAGGCATTRRPTSLIGVALVALGIRARRRLARAA